MYLKLFPDAEDYDPSEDPYFEEIIPQDEREMKSALDDMRAMGLID